MRRFKQCFFNINIFKSLFFIILGLLFTLCAISTSSSEELLRNKGLSVYLIPQGASLQSGFQYTQAGYMVAQQSHLSEDGGYIFATVEELLSYFDSLPQDAQDNGIWLVVTHPDSYSPEEKDSVEQLKKLCIKKNIPLFICRGSKLPDGWVQIS